ncbi:hypothetical protein AAG906_021728 [Vitis piasezkii]
MANPSSSSHIESFSTTRPPFFMGTDYPYWKTKMTWFLQSINIDLWDIIEDGPHIPSKLENGVMVPKPKHEWDELDRKKVQLNAKVIFILHCVIDRNEFNRIWQCKSAKEIWRLLENTYEGNNQVKESRINILVHDYELFSIKDFESIVEMFSRFIVIVNELEALGKTYTEVEKVMKILRSLLKKWETKVTAIQEANDLTKLSLEELIGSLITYEIELYNHQIVEENEKSIAFMASINDDEEEESESESDEDSIEEECTNEDVNTCFMALEEHQDEVNSNSNHFEFQDVLQKLYFDLEKLDFKNSCLQNELNEHNENFENIEKAKISFEKENEELKILKWPKDF